MIIEVMGSQIEVPDGLSEQQVSEIVEDFASKAGQSATAQPQQQAVGGVDPEIARALTPTLEGVEAAKARPDSTGSEATFTNDVRRMAERAKEFGKEVVTTFKDSPFQATGQLVGGVVGARGGAPGISAGVAGGGAVGSTLDALILGKGDGFLPEVSENITAGVLSLIPVGRVATPAVQAGLGAVVDQASSKLIIDSLQAGVAGGAKAIGAGTTTRTVADAAAERGGATAQGLTADQAEKQLFKGTSLEGQEVLTASQKTNRRVGASEALKAAEEAAIAEDVKHGSAKLFKLQEEANRVVANTLSPDRRADLYKQSSGYKDITNKALDSVSSALATAENVAAKTSKLKDAVVPASGLYKYMIDNEGTLVNAFGEKGYRDLLKKFETPRMMNVNGNIIPVIDADTFHAAELALRKNLDPQQAGLYYKVDEAGKPIGVLGAFYDALGDAAAINKQSATFSQAFAARDKLRFRISAMRDSPAVKAMLEGEPTKLKNIFSSRENYEAAKAVLNEVGVDSRRTLERTAREMLFAGNPAAKIRGAYNDKTQEITAASFDAALKQFSPEVLEDVLGKDGYRRVVAALAFKQFEATDKAVLNAAKATVRQAGLTDVLSTYAKRQAQPLTDVSSFWMFTKRLRTKLFPGKDVEALRAAMSSELGKKIIETNIDDPLAYSLYRGVANYAKVQALTEDQWNEAVLRAMLGVDDE